APLSVRHPLFALQDFVLLLYTFASLPFFFQAEDGIRVFHVTGVQTCALPICVPVPDPVMVSMSPAAWAMRPPAWPCIRGGWPGRSEERRVGKECRFVWTGDL